MSFFDSLINAILLVDNGHYYNAAIIFRDMRINDSYSPKQRLQLLEQLCLIAAGKDLKNLYTSPPKDFNEKYTPEMQNIINACEKKDFSGFHTAFLKVKNLYRDDDNKCDIRFYKAMPTPDNPIFGVLFLKIYNNHF